MRLIPHHPAGICRSAPTTSKNIRRGRSIVVLALVSAAIALGAHPSAGSVAQLFTRAAGVFAPTQPSQTSATKHSESAAMALLPQTPSPSMTLERRGHTATHLSNARVLIAGGENSYGVLNQTEIYDSTAATFSAAANMGDARVDHTATLLSDGRVLFTGGRNAVGPVATTEIFDPTAGTFSNGPNMSVARAGHSATLLADGRILIAGGDGSGSAEIIDASLSSSNRTGSLVNARSMHSAALMQDGRVLIVGGRDAGGTELSSGEIFDNGSFASVDGALHVARVRAHLRVLFDGKVQIIGGSNDGSMEIYDPSIQTFGAYAHVAPEGDTCAGLPGQVQSSQTRAALFYNGQSDPTYDRSSHTMSELSGQAIIIGGANSAGGVLSSTPLFSSSNAQISTDKLDYSPGETAHITGRGFQPGETVRLKIHEDPHTPQERGMDVVADGDGNFVADYLVAEYDLDMKFIVGARGLTSGLTAQTTFTDAQPTAVALVPNSQTVAPGGSAAYTVNVTVGGNSGNCAMTLTAPFSAPAPVGVGVTFSGGGTINTNASFSKTLTLSTTNTGPMAGRTQPGTYQFTLTVARGAGCQGSGTETASGTLIVASPNVAPVASAVSIAGTAQYAQLLTGNYTYSDADGDLQGASTFRWLRNGTTQVGTNQTYTTVAADVGQTLTFEVTPVAATGTSPGTAVQSAALTINKKPVTPSVTASNKTYDGNTAATSNCSLTGVVAADVGNVTCSAAGPNTFADANVGNGKIVTATNISLSGSASGNYVLTATSATTTANITTKAITATLTAANKEYDGTNTEPNASMSCSLSGVLGGDTANVACTATSGTFNSANVATATQVTATVTISGTASGNYTLGAAGTNTSSTSATANAQITAKTLTASIVGNPMKTYDGNTTATLTPANFSLTGLVGSESFTINQTSGSYNSADVATATTVTANLLPAHFTAGPGTLATNYNLPTTASGAGQIAKANADCSSIAGVTVPYDGNAHGATGSCKGVNGNDLAGLNLGASFTNVPGGTANWTFTDVSGNYNDAAGSVNIVINKVNADCSSIAGVTVPYDGNAHGATGSCKGVNGNDLAGLNLGASFTNVPGGPANWTFTDVSGNYNNANGSVAIVINKVSQTITWANPAPIVYGTALGMTQLNATVSGVSGGSAAGTLTYSPAAGTILNAGNGQTLAVDAAATTNYNAAHKEVSINVNKAPLTVKADDKVMLFGGTVPAFTVTDTGFVAGDTPSSLSGVLTFTVKDLPAMATTIIPNASTPSGPYAIIPNGLTSSNYEVTLSNGTLTISPWWTLTGFYQPVDMNAGSTFILNIVKGGSTVPLKFNIYAGTPGPLTERKTVSDVMFGSVQVAEYNCAATPGYEIPMDVPNTGGTSLRYDPTGAQFIQNWQTPKGANKCYQVRMTALDGSHIDAYFKTK